MGDSKATPSRRQIRRFPLAIGVLLGADVQGELRIRRLVAFSLPIRLVFVGLGLDFIPVRKSLVFFCFPRVFSGGFDVGGDWCLTVVDWCGMRGFGVSIGGSNTDEVILIGFLCVFARFFRGFLFSGCIHVLSSPVGLGANDMATGGWRIFCFLQGARSVDCGSLMRFVIHQLVTSWCSLIPLEGSLHVDWGWPAE
jgi:hypothetical protein